MPNDFYTKCSAFQDALHELERFDAATSETVPEPGTDLYITGCMLEEQVRVRFAVLAATDPCTLHEACLLQRAVLAQIGYFVQDHEPDAHEAMTRVASFLEHAEKNSA